MDTLATTDSRRSTNLIPVQYMHTLAHDFWSREFGMHLWRLGASDPGIHFGESREGESAALVCALSDGT